MRILAKYLGGSHLYGLNTPESDKDERFIFINDTVGQIIGLDKNEHVVRQNEKEDVSGMELRRFFNLLRRGNTGAVECLWAKVENFSVLDSTFKDLVLADPNQFMDSEAFYKSLRGYALGERRLMNGDRTGKLGSKRQENIQKYGYSYKNAVQLLRLLYSGIFYFKTARFPVNLSDVWPNHYNFLLEVKNFPQKFSKDQINKKADEAEKELEEAFNKNGFGGAFKFNVKLSNFVVYHFYKSLLDQIMDKTLARHITHPTEDFSDNWL